MSAPTIDLPALPPVARPMLAWTARATQTAISALVAFTLLALARWTLTDSVVPWDSKNQFYPMVRFLADSLAEGEIPLWNPYHFSGYPTVADPQSGLFTPTLLLLAWLRPGFSTRMFDVWIMLHLLFGGLAILGLFRRRGWGAAGAVLAGMVFMLGGSAAARLQHTGMIISYAILPAAWWALEVALERRSVGAAIAFALLAATMALGRDQVAFLGCLLFLCLLAWECWRSPAPPRWLLSRLPLLLLSGSLGAAILAVPALLTLQLLHASNRPGFAFGVAAAGSLSPINFVTLFSANFLGTLNADYSYFGPGYATSDAPDWTDRAINYLFIGALPSLLIGWHGLACGRFAATALRAIAVLGVVALFYALGSHTPLFAPIFDHLPGIALYRRPADATFLLNLACAMAAGYLLHRYVVSGLPRPALRLGAWPARLLMLGAVATILVLIADALLFSAARGHLDASARSLGLAMLAAAAGAALLVLGARRGSRPLAAALFAAAAGAELLANNAATGINAEPSSRYALFDAPTPAEAAALNTLRGELDARHDEGGRPRVEIVGLPGLWMNGAMVLRLEDTLGYNPLRIIDYARAVGVGDNAGDIDLRHFPDSFRSYQGRLASLLGLEYLVFDRPLSRLPRQVPRPSHATLIFSSDAIYIYKLGPAAPRASFATRLRLVDTEAALDGEDLPDFDRVHEALVDVASLQQMSADYAAHEGGGVPAEANSDIDIAAYHNNRVVIDVDTDQAGMLVLHDLYYPGWQASVDGQRKPLLRANLLFRGVELARGHHVVQFDFRPFSVENLLAAWRAITAPGG